MKSLVMIGLLAVAAVSFANQPVSAATCTGTDEIILGSAPQPTHTDVVTFNAAGATCYGAGHGPNDINGSGAQDVILASNSDLVLFDKIEVPDDNSGLFDDVLSWTGEGTTAGTVTISGLPSSVSNVIIGFKFGGGMGADPSWGAFVLPDPLVQDIAWTWSYDGPTGLSHVTLYGVIPLPGALLLLLSGLVGIGLLGRTRTKVAAN